MTSYLVRARLRPDMVGMLRALLERGDLKDVEPFGEEMDRALKRARVQGTPRELLWEERCHCTPPLAAEREVLERYFNDIRVEEVEPGQGWARIDELDPWLTASSEPAGRR